MENTQVQTPVTDQPVSTDVQVPVSTNGVQPELQEIIVQTPGNEPTNPSEVQVQPQTPEQNSVVELQRKLNERQIAEYQAQQRAEQAERLLQQIAIQRTPQNDPEPQLLPDGSNWRQIQQWDLRQSEKRMMNTFEQTQKSFMDNLMNTAQEATFQQKYPDANIQQVKAFAQMRGIQYLEDAYTLMSMPTLMNNAALNGSKQTINQIRQPNGAIPINSRGATNPIQPESTPVSFERMLQVYNVNPDAADKWPPELKKMFLDELRKHERQ
jgi:hypothetical protein